MVHWKSGWGAIWPTFAFNVNRTTNSVKEAHLPWDFHYDHQASPKAGA